MQTHIKDSYRNKAPFNFLFIVVEGVTIIETITPGVFWAVGEDYSQTGKEWDLDPAHWDEVLTEYRRLNKVPRKGSYFSFQPPR